MLLQNATGLREWGRNSLNAQLGTTFQKTVSTPTPISRNVILSEFTKIAQIDAWGWGALRVLGYGGDNMHSQYAFSSVSLNSVPLNSPPSLPADLVQFEFPRSFHMLGASRGTLHPYQVLEKTWGLPRISGVTDTSNIQGISYLGFLTCRVQVTPDILG